MISRTKKIMISFILGVFLLSGCLAKSNEIKVNNTITKIKTFKSNFIDNNPVLVVVLHGDSPFKKPDYHYEFAKIVASKSSNVVTIGMLRPGYTDLMGNTSDGEKGEAIGDSYDLKRVNQITEAIKELKKIHTPIKTILAGHSGGSAITANVISLYPNLIDHAFIVSCPCDVSNWRKDMLALSKKEVFRGEIDTLSPLDLVEKLTENTNISMFVGNTDRVTLPKISENYKNAALEQGAKVTLKIINGKHDIFLHPLILGEMTEVIESYNKIPRMKKKNKE